VFPSLDPCFYVYNTDVDISDGLVGPSTVLQAGRSWVQFPIRSLDSYANILFYFRLESVFL
jgi:hypothetical protein